LILKTGLTDDEAKRHEIYMIFVLGRKNIGTGRLINLTSGGESKSGWVCPEEYKQKWQGEKGCIFCQFHNQYQSRKSSRWIEQNQIRVIYLTRLA
jgi:hypothetical protein